MTIKTVARDTRAPIPVRMASLDQVVIRCGCTEKQKVSPNFHARRGKPCPNPRATEDLGTVAYWHRNPLRRVAWRVGRLFRSLGFVRS